MRGRFMTTILALATGLSFLTVLSLAQTTNPKAAPATAASSTKSASLVQKDVPAEFKAAISQLAVAKSSLEKAGDKWGGHRIQAIHFVDAALEATGQSHVVAPGEMNSGPKDEPAAMQSGISSLQSAQSDFEKSGNQWGGKRAKALADISQALKELQAGIDYAKANHTY